MSCCIQLDVSFTKQAAHALRLAGLQFPWHEPLKGMKFKSPQPNLSMGKIALQIETVIERIFRQCFPDPNDEIQVQILKITNEANTKVYNFEQEASQSVRVGDNIVIDLEAFRVQQLPEFSQEVIEKVRSMLRFSLNDRVLCYWGPRWLSGFIVDTAVPQKSCCHTKKKLLPYLVRTDPLPGLPTKTIFIPSDRDDVCTQEVCFDPVAQLLLVRSAASPANITKKPELRFAVGDEVVCRIQNDLAEDLENWVAGRITEIWSKIEEASWDLDKIAGKFPDILPYKIELDSGEWLYCHKDHHTLIRKKNMKPVGRVRGISKRMETVKEADGSKFTIDHVTGRRKRMLADCDSD